MVLPGVLTRRTLPAAADKTAQPSGDGPDQPLGSVASVASLTTGADGALLDSATGTWRLTVLPSLKVKLTGTVCAGYS